MLSVTISNNIRVRTHNTKLRAALTKPLVIDNPEYVKRKQRGKRTWGLDKSLKIYAISQGDLIIPRGFEEELKRILKDEGFNPDQVITRNQYEGPEIDFGTWNPEYKLRAFQKPAVEACIKNNGVLVAPAGSGKTIMACKYIQEKARRTLWLTHTKDLMYQTRKRAKATLGNVGNIGIIGDGKRVWGDGKLIIATIQTLAENPDLITALDDIIGTVVVDEAHHIPAPMFMEVVGQFKAKNLLGITATPQRKDKLEAFMYRAIGPKLFEIKRDDLYKAGFLVKPKIKFVYTDFDYEQASIKQGTNVDAGGEDLDYNELMNVLINDDDRAWLVAKTIVEYLPKGFTLVIGENIRYLHKLDFLVSSYTSAHHIKKPKTAVVHSQLQQYGWRVVRNEQEAKLLVEAGEARRYKYSTERKTWLVDLKLYTDEEYKNWQKTNADRKKILKQAEKGELDILFATQLAREGLDYPHLRVLHIVTPKRGDQGSRRDGAAVEQETGRLQRPDPKDPNKEAWLIDYVDYNVEVFKSQYYSRRNVYKRLGLTVPRKPATETEKLDQLLDQLNLPGLGRF